ncbi:conserved Plasmodium protein, unknown function [Plasmodium relictum]|uniref:RNA polymerase Rpb7-like N-terminal domain-containing protein n=1 Tax=Plasmodium relictum TaxID=85471 RepID=A0A1J1H280_PLARL|nr:conserved Plasmodium protein, unknown function [Plasmodium relictum]CRG98789.1 conserved Plasmodium protein, unknown function [Plasmodium relictum]
MAQNPWYIKKSKVLRTSKLENFINKFNEDYDHLMHIPKFKYIKNTLGVIFENPGLIINKKTFNIVRISCVAQLQPKYLNNVKDGLSIYLSKFMLKVNHDVEGFSLCFNNIKLKEKEPKIINSDPSNMFLKISFKLLILVLKENHIIKAKINKIEPTKIHLDIFGIIEAILIEEIFKDFCYDSNNNTFIKENNVYSLNDIINFTIKRITYSDSGSNVKLIGYF